MLNRVRIGLYQITGKVFQQNRTKVDLSFKTCNLEHCQQFVPVLLKFNQKSLKGTSELMCCSIEQVLVKCVTAHIKWNVAYFHIVKADKFKDSILTKTNHKVTILKSSNINNRSFKSHSHTK